MLEAEILKSKSSADVFAKITLNGEKLSGETIPFFPNQSRFCKRIEVESVISIL